MLRLLKLNLALPNKPNGPNEYLNCSLDFVDWALTLVMWMVSPGGELGVSSAIIVPSTLLESLSD